MRRRTTRLLLELLMVAAVTVWLSGCDGNEDAGDDGAAVGANADGGGVRAPQVGFVPTWVEPTDDGSAIRLEGWSVSETRHGASGRPRPIKMAYHLLLATMRAEGTVLADFDSYEDAREAGALPAPGETSGDYLGDVRFRDYEGVIPVLEHMGIGFLRIPGAGDTRRALFWLYDEPYGIGRDGEMQVLDCDTVCCVSHEFWFSWPAEGTDLPVERLPGRRLDGTMANWLHTSYWTSPAFQTQCAEREPRPLAEWDDYDSCDFGVLLMTADLYCPCPPQPCEDNDMECRTCHGLESGIYF